MHMYVYTGAYALASKQSVFPSLGYKKKSGETSSSLSGHCVPVEVRLADHLAAWEIAEFSEFEMDAQDEVNPDCLPASISASHHRPAAHLPIPSLPSCCFFISVCSPLPPKS